MPSPFLELKIDRASRHPWIYHKMVRWERPAPPAGEWMAVKDRAGKFVGRGIVNFHSLIAVRLLTEKEDETLDRAWLEGRLIRALEFRRDVLGLEAVTDSYRLVHGESDGLSGLIIDKLGNVAVIELYSAGWLGVLADLAEMLKKLLPGVSVGVKVEERTETREGIDMLKPCARFPLPPRAEVRENGIAFDVNFTDGHKTGFFLDQRENRAAIASMAKGRNCLDLCCYTGGFALSLMKGGAASVTAVDLDEKALAVAKVNGHRNQLQVDWVHQNAFDYLRQGASENRKYDLIVVDPAKLAAVPEELSRAVKMYGDLNRLAIQSVVPGGLILTCSCAGLVPEEHFLSILHRAAGDAARTLQIFRISGAAADHPVLNTFPEGRYLKAVFARVG